jgi:hypothetical protein
MRWPLAISHPICFGQIDQRISPLSLIVQKPASGTCAGLRLRPDGESDIIWNRGLELTPTDGQHRFAEASELLAKLQNSPLSTNSTFSFSQAFKHQENLRSVAL